MRDVASVSLRADCPKVSGKAGGPHLRRGEAIVSAIEHDEVLARAEKQKGCATSRAFREVARRAADTKGFCFHTTAPHSVTSITDTVHPFVPD